MKKLTIIMLSLVALIATSCGSKSDEETTGSKYNEKTCEDLCEKINDGMNLTDDDYAECIRQCSAILDDMNAQLEKIKSKAEAGDDKAIDMWEDLREDSEQKLEYFSTMYYMLSNADLKGENKSDFKELEVLEKSVGRLWERTNKKVNRLDD